MSIKVVVATATTKAEAYLIPVTTTEVKKSLSKQSAGLIKSLISKCSDLFSAMNFEGKKGQVCLHVAGGTPVAFVGLGALDQSSDENREELRRALGSGYNALHATKKTKISVSLPDLKPFGVTRDVFFEQVTTLLHIASYRFVEFKKDKKVWSPTLALVGATKADAAAIDAGTIIGEATNMTRGLADTPPNHMVPEDMANRAKAIAKAHGLKFSEISEKKARDMGMGCFNSVAKGSINDGRIVTLEYKPKAKDVPTIALVGKGVCFDTGGISLKPANAMSGMKYDMSGAAAVFGAMQAIAQLKPNIHVVGITPLVENMPDGSASKQDDVVTALNGLTVEIENTDAEGRLILADAMVHVQKTYKPAYMIDIATLTGACAYFLGHFFAGLMTRDDKMSELLQKIGYHVGDKLWRLPLTDDYKPALESPVADVANCGSPVYKAGATTAGLFLEHFVEKDVKWAHLDIAGTDNKIPGTKYLGRGATGTGVRIMIDFARSLSK